ncbi:MAG: RelA/SpoT domain-containing protein [Actinomycetota bacterium]
MTTQAPWSGNQLKKLSRHIRDDTSPPDGLPTYDEVMLWFNDLAAQVQQRINDLDWSSLLNSQEVEVTSRPKTIDTLRQKLLRDPGTPLPSVQDIAGVRFEAEMSLEQQDAVAWAIAGAYGQGAESVKDLREDPHSGYRAVHVWLRLPARVEVQIRTHLQGAWANAYEAAADVLGRSIRYGELPADPMSREIVEALQAISVEQIAAAEQQRTAIERDLLRWREDSSGAPVYRRQVQARLEEDWEQRRLAEREVRDALRSIHDQFRSLHGRI